MKYLLTAILISAGCLYFFSQKEETKATAKMTKTLLSSELKKLTQESQKLPTQKEHKLPSLETIEENLSSMSMEELKVYVNTLEQFEKEKQFIQKANSNSLTADETAELTLHIRQKSVAYKILLDRQLEDFEREVL